ncbi:MAG: hypothetical protein J6O51_03805 [Bacteroidales bacterium]|nr:hypothetical protein [Bacteroidales bacterium]
MANKLLLSEEVWSRLEAVTPEEKEKALRKLARWITYEIVHRGFDLDYGPFSFAAMGGNTVEVISQQCYDVLFGGEWHWKPTRELSSMLIQIAKSKMSHIIRDWHAQGRPDIKHTSELSYREQVEMDIARQWEAEANMRELGFDIARKALSGNPKMQAYVEAVYETNDYRAVATRLKMTLKEVQELERELLAILEKC